MTRLDGLYLLVDESVLPHARWNAILDECLDTRPALVQYRAKELPHAQAAEHARQLQQACQARNIALLINDDVALCRDIGAAGVHLGRQDGGIRQARELLGPNAIIGATCYADLARAEQAIQASADYVSFGRLFTSTTKPQAPGAPLTVLTQARQRFDVPICGIGGIDLDNATSVRSAGAALICVAGGIWNSPDPVASCEKLATICAESPSLNS